MTKGLIITKITRTEKMFFTNLPILLSGIIILKIEVKSTIALILIIQVFIFNYIKALAEIIIKMIVINSIKPTEISAVLK